MINLLKSKFFLGVMVVAIMFVGAFALNTEKASADCSIYSTLRIGSVGVDVQCLQTKVGANADGKFGPMTLASVKAWQASHGLVADGIVGPITRVALNAEGTVVINFPVGCTSAVGYSPITGVKCDGISSGLPAGCMPGYLFSATTGQKCDGTTQAGGSTSTILQGGSGSLESADFVSSLNNEKVGEGQDNVQILGLDLEADDESDLRIASVKVEFKEQGAGGSDDFDDYADKVTVWFDSKQVGSTDVDDMSERKGVWSKTISLSNISIIKRGDTERLVVEVFALNNIDSSDLGSANNDWEITVASIRYEDAQGVVLTESSTGDIGVGRAFYFDRFSSANDVELRVSEASDNPTKRTVQVDENGGDEVTLLIGKLEAEGSDLELTELALAVNPVGASAEEMASRFILMINGDEVDSIDADKCEDVTEDCSNDNDQTATYVFDDFKVTIDEGDSVEFKIVAELNDFDGDFGSGDSLAVSVDSDSIEAEDESGDVLGNNERTGTAVGEVQTFQNEGLSAQLNSATAVAQSAGQNKVVGKYTFVIDITANGSSFWIDEDGMVSVNASVSDPDANITSINIDSSNATLTANDNFRISNGQTRRFTVEVFVDMDSGEDGSVRVTLDDIEYKTNDDNDPTEDANLDLGSPTYRSGTVYLITP